MEDQEFLKCDICFEQYGSGLQRPRILVCGHTFCHSCLENLLENKSVCPDCRSSIKYNTAESIPINYVVKNLAELQSEQNHDHYSLCKEHFSYENFQCIDCNIQMCSTCGMLNHKACKTIILDDVKLKKSIKYSKQIDKIEVLLERKILEFETCSKRYRSQSETLDGRINNLKLELETAEEESRNVNKLLLEMEEELETTRDKLKEMKELKGSTSNILQDENFELEKLESLIQELLSSSPITQNVVSEPIQVTTASAPPMDLLETTTGVYVQKNVPTAHFSSTENRNSGCFSTNIHSTSIGPTNDYFAQSLVNESHNNAGRVLQYTPSWIQHNCCSPHKEGLLSGKYFRKDRRFKIDSFESHNCAIGPFDMDFGDFCERNGHSRNTIPNEVFMEIWNGKTYLGEVTIKLEGIGPRSRSLNFLAMISGFLEKSYKGYLITLDKSNWVTGGFKLDDKKRIIPLGAAINGIIDEVQDFSTFSRGSVLGGDAKYNYKLSQFYIFKNDMEDTNRQFVKFARVTSGMNLIDAINQNCTIRECGFIL